MFAYLCLSLIILLAVDGNTPSNESIDSRQLYALAAKSIAAGELENAIESLKVLADEDYAVPPIAEVSAFHLAECYLLTNQPQQAMHVLIGWTRKVANSSSADAIHPGLGDRLVELADKTCRRMEPTDDSLSEIKRYLQSVAETSASDTVAGSTTLTRLQKSIAPQLAQRLLRLERFAEALEVIERYPAELLSDESSVQGSFRIVGSGITRFQVELAWAHHDLQHQRSHEAVERLQQMLEVGTLQNEQTIAVRFSLSEALAANQQAAAALEQLDQLAALADDTSGIPSQSSWRASVDLRRAELLIKQRRLVEAVQVLEQSKLAYPDFVRRHEFDYLLARCAIANAEFDDARQHLNAIVGATDGGDQESSFKAQWMIGETYFLQRQYQPAVDAYAEIINRESQSVWRARALMQAGKCCEHLGQTSLAIENYKRILQEWSAHDQELATTYQEALERSELLLAHREKLNSRIKR